MANTPNVTPAPGADALSAPEMLQRAMEGFRHYEEGRFSEALGIFEKLAALDPSEGYYRTALGAIYLAEERLEQALNSFNAALEMNGTDSTALVNRGEVHLRLGNIMEAARDFARVIELDPYGEDPLTERARLLAATALETIEAAQREAGVDTSEKG